MITPWQPEAGRTRQQRNGNGRTGYVLNNLSLVEHGLLPMPILYMSRYIIANRNSEKTTSVRALADETADFVRSRLPKINSRESVDVLLKQPDFRVANLVEAGIMANEAASRYLKALTAGRVLQERTVGREKLFKHPKILDLLTNDTHDFDRYS